MWRLGGLAEDAGDLELAESWYQKAVDRGNSDGMLGLARLAYEAGDLELAKSWLQKAVDLGNQNAIDALRALDAS